MAKKKPDKPRSPAAKSGGGSKANKSGDAAGVPARRPAAPDPAAVRQVLAWMLDGHAGQDIAEAIAAEFPKQNAEALLTAVYDHLAQVGDFDAQVLRGWCAEAYRELYRRMVEMKDYPGALRALKELERLAGTSE